MIIEKAIYELEKSISGDQAQRPTQPLWKM